MTRDDLGGVFAPPGWLRDLGFLSWFLVGVGLLLFGLIWILGATSTIVMPVVSGTIAASVAVPLVDALARRRVPRAAGAALVLLLLLAIAVVVALLVLGGIAEQREQISAYATQALNKAEGWAKDAGPLAVLVVTIAAGSLFGMIGLVLGAPLTSAAVHIANELAATRSPQDADVPEAPPLPATGA